MKTAARIQLEPIFVDMKAAAAMLAISVRSFEAIVARGDIARISIPGMRRVVFCVEDLRALAKRWCESCRADHPIQPRAEVQGSGLKKGTPKEDGARVQ